jgi:hypothetical protein
MVYQTSQVASIGTNIRDSIMLTGTGSIYNGGLEGIIFYSGGIRLTDSIPYFYFTTTGASTTRPKIDITIEGSNIISYST